MTNPNDPNQPYGQQPYGAPQGQPYGQQPPAAPVKKKRKWPWILLAIVVVFIVIAAVGGGGDDDSSTATATTTAASAQTRDNVEAPAEEAPASTIPPLVAAPPSGEGKQITYEVISDSPTLGNVTWFDEASALQQDTNVDAPWSLSLSNNSTVSIVGVTAQTEGQSVTCRIVVDGEVEDEQTATGQYAVVSCNAPGF